MTLAEQMAINDLLAELHKQLHPEQSPQAAEGATVQLDPETVEQHTNGVQT